MSITMREMIDPDPLQAHNLRWQTAARTRAGVTPNARYRGSARCTLIASSTANMSALDNTPS